MKGKTQKGITLIALIITIVVLLIIAVVAVGAVQESSIIMHAQNAKERYEVEKTQEAIKLALSEGKLENYGSINSVTDIIRIYEGKEEPEAVNIAVNAKSIPENMPAGNYYIITPDKYASNNNENIRRYARLTSRGEAREENILKDVYVINEQLDIYYIIEANLSVADDEEIVIAAEEDLATVGYFYNTTYNPEQPEIVTIDEYYDDENNDKISDINSSLRAYTSGYDFDVPVTFFSQTPPTQGDIQATITNYDGTEEIITLTTTNNKKWTYKSMILTGKEEPEWEEYIAFDFYPYAKYSSSPSRYETNAGTHYFAFDSSNAMPFHKITILGATIEFPFNCQAYVGWGDLDFYDNMNPVYNDISKVSKVIVNFSDNTSKKYTNENIFDVNQYYSEDSCFYYSSQDIPILYTNGAFIINMPESSLKNPITSIIVEEDGIATKYNVTESTEIINSSAWN